MGPPQPFTSPNTGARTEVIPLFGKTNFGRTFTTAVLGIVYFTFDLARLTAAYAPAFFIVKLIPFGAHVLNICRVTNTLTFFWVPLKVNGTSSTLCFALTTAVFTGVHLGSIVAVRWFYFAQTPTFGMVRHADRNDFL